MAQLAQPFSQTSHVGKNARVTPSTHPAHASPITLGDAARAFPLFWEQHSAWGLTFRTRLKPRGPAP